MESNEKFYLAGSNIVSTASGNVVASIVDNAVVMAAGYNGQGKAVKAWYAAFTAEQADGQADGQAAGQADGTDTPDAPEIPAGSPEYTENPDFILPDPPVDDPLPDDELPPALIPGTLSVGTAAPAAPDHAPVDPAASMIIADIPDEQLPVMDPAFGIGTPAVAAFIRKHGFSADQITALVRRLEMKMKGL